MDNIFKSVAAAPRKMTEKEIQHNIDGAVSMLTYLTPFSGEGPGDKVMYWEEYAHGMRKLLDKSINDPSEHSQLLAYADSRHSQLRMRGRGYVDGFSGMPIDQAIFRFGKLMAAIERGATKSPGRAAASKVNAALGGQAGKGVKKPRKVEGKPEQFGFSIDGE